jgi:hypothetical protein
MTHQCIASQARSKPPKWATAHRMLNELYFRLKHLGRLVQHSRLSTDKGSDIFSFSRGGVKVVVTSRKVTIRSIEPLSVFWQEKTAYSSRFH